MENLKNYIEEVLGVSIKLIPLKKTETDRLPFYIKESFRFSEAELFNHSVIFLESLSGHSFTTIQYEKILELVKNIYRKDMILIPDQLSSLGRKRLIQRRINFIVPGTQLFLPSLLTDLRETYKLKADKSGKLLPSAQLILLYRILHGKIIETLPLKALAKKLGYTPMGITKSVENLKKLDLCTTEGTKEKYICFNKNKQAIWQSAQPSLSSPVLKKIFVDELPTNVLPLKSNESALTEYTDMAETRQVYLAMGKEDYYALQKKRQLKNENESEGLYCIEVWKYDPAILAIGISKKGNVDPLSLFLSLKETKDERIESAREQIIENYIVKWSGD